jgi:hypothetical protein
VVQRVCPDGDRAGSAWNLRVAADRGSAPPAAAHRRPTGRGVNVSDLVADAQLPRTSVLRYLDTRDWLGTRFMVGIVLHSGPEGARLGDRIISLPISALWA